MTTSERCHRNQCWPLRYCTGGCSNPNHFPHLYTVDPVDGPLDREFLCPGNAGECREYLDDETGERTLFGFIPTTDPTP